MPPKDKRGVDDRTGLKGDVGRDTVSPARLGAPSFTRYGGWAAGPQRLLPGATAPTSGSAVFGDAGPACCLPFGHRHPADCEPATVLASYDLADDRSTHFGHVALGDGLPVGSGRGPTVGLRCRDARPVQPAEHTLARVGGVVGEEESSPGPDGDNSKSHKQLAHGSPSLT